VQVLGTEFQNPILLAAGTAGFGRELDGVLDLDRLGGLVTKAVSREPRHGNPPPSAGEVHAGMLNSVGLANPGLDVVRARELPWLANRLERARVIVNVVGFSEAEYAEVIAGLDESPIIAAYEVNLSCPNTSAGGLEFGADAGSVHRIVSGCRARTRKPILAKLSPTLPDIPAMAVVALESGAQGVSLVNTMPGLIYEDSAPRLGNGNGGVSGPPLLPVGLLATARVRERLPHAVIVGVGGIRTMEHVRQYFCAGANLVAIGTAALADPRLPERLAEGWAQGARDKR